MKNFKTLILFALIFVNGVFSETPESDLKNPKGEIEIFVAVAANFKNPFEDIRVAFLKQNPQIKITMVSGASGQLTNQIRNGAPVDIFLSADMDFPLTLFNEGFAENKPKVYAIGKLILMSQAEKNKTFSVQEHLLSQNTKFIAIANPKTAPYGRAAEETLKYYGIYEKVKGKLVFGENITQVNQFISTGSADFGFTSLSTAKAKENHNLFWKSIDRKSYTPILQGVIITSSKESRSKDKISAVYMFFDYLFSKEIQTILTEYGYASAEE
ncbi:molybdate ABC transporter substrate-binding protein [Leptospira noumeaensis]|uniref:Molybdate ABC transporter substrate-binding protein n=1 Tax=Leptospira noumeaensis TaxID=2484964 RepID=A0A4R9IGW8_9LEPT|nr:molybdate ABC transporter substrate-binding protein [Leptospira noumeaensis]TGK87675.1 molybdate ABC transporter substrate-binding protein [Leptospira noumeaensis]